MHQVALYITTRYLENERQQLNLPKTQKVLVVMNVRAALNKNHICVANVPVNMTCFYEPLDLTLNGHGKKFMRKDWCTSEIMKQLDEVVKLDEVDVKPLLSTLKQYDVG